MELLPDKSTVQTPELIHDDSIITDVALTSPKTTDVFRVHQMEVVNTTLDPYLGGSNSQVLEPLIALQHTYSGQQFVMNWT